MRAVTELIEKLRTRSIEYVGRTEKEVVIIFLALMLVGGGVALVAVNSPVVTAALLGGWLFAVFIYRLDGRASVAVGLIFLLLCPVLLLFGGDSYALRSAYIAYLFLIVGVVQLFIKALRRN